MVVNPTLFADILNPSGGIAQYFIRNDAVGEGNHGLRSGMIGSLYGIDVYMSNTVSSSGTDGVVAGAVFHKSACQPLVSRWDDTDPGCQQERPVSCQTYPSGPGRH